MVSSGLIVHAYVLLHFAMLSSKVSTFDQALRDQIEDGEIRTRLRRQLPSNVFVQFLAGPATFDPRTRAAKRTGTTGRPRAVTNAMRGWHPGAER